MPNRIRRVGGGLKGGVVVGKTSRLGGLHSLNLGRYATGFEPAILSTSPYGNVWLAEIASAGSAQDASIEYGASSVEVMSVAGRASGYVYSGKTSANGSNISTIQKLDLSSVSPSTLSAVASPTRAEASASCGDNTGYVAGGYSGSSYLATVDKFSFESESVSANSGAFTSTRRGGGGYRNGVYGCHVGGNQGSSSFGYYGIINHTTEAVTEYYHATLDSQYGRSLRPAVVSSGNGVGYICGGMDPYYTNQLTVIKAQFPGGDSFSELSSSLSNYRRYVQGFSSPTKGYVTGGGWDGNCDAFEFSTETVSTFASAYNYYSHHAGIIGSSKGFFCGGDDGGSSYALIHSITLATDTAAIESATLDVVTAYGIGMDAQSYSAGGANDSPSGSLGIPTMSVDESAAATGSEDATQISTIFNMAVTEPSGSGLGVFAGGIYWNGSGGVVTGWLAEFPYATETIRINVNKFIEKYKAQTLSYGATAFFAGGYSSLGGGGDAWLHAYNTDDRSVSATAVCNRLDGCGIDYNSSGYLFGDDGMAAWVQKRNHLTAAMSQFTTSTTIGGKMAGMLGDYFGYLFCGDVSPTRVTKCSFKTDAFSSVSATMPNSRYNPESVSLNGSGFIAGGSDSAVTTQYTTVDGFLSSTETSRTTSASLSSGRYAFGSVSGYAAGYFGSSWNGGAPATQYIDRIDFATEAMTATTATNMYPAAKGASIRPETGAGATGIAGCVGTMTTGRSESATADTLLSGGTVTLAAIAASATAGHTFDSVMLAVASRSESASSDASPSVLLVATSESSELASATATPFVSGVDVGSSAPASATSDQSASAVFATDHNGGTLAAATQTVITFFVSEGTAAGNANTTPTASAIITSDNTGEASATATTIGEQTKDVEIDNQLSASAIATAGFAFNAGISSGVTATVEQDGWAGRGVIAAANARAFQSAIISTFKVAITEASDASASAKGFAITFTDVQAAASSEAQASAVTRLMVAHHGAANAEAQPISSVSFSATSKESLAALDDAFATGILTASASEALLAIVASFAKRAGEFAETHRMLIVTKAKNLYSVFAVNERRAMESIGSVYAIVKDDNRITVKTDSDGVQLVVKGPSSV